MSDNAPENFTQICRVAKGWTKGDVAERMKKSTKER